MYSSHAWPQSYDRGPSLPYNAGTDDVGFSGEGRGGGGGRFACPASLAFVRFHPKSKQAYNRFDSSALPKPIRSQPYFVRSDLQPPYSLAFW